MAEPGSSVMLNGITVCTITDSTAIVKNNDAILKTRMPTANPFQDPLRFERRMPECVVVIFGANGDLTKRKLMPALYRLMYERRLSPGFAVIGISRTPLSDEKFRDEMRESVQKFLEDSPFDEDVWSGFSQGL